MSEFWDLVLAGGFFMWPLVLCSIVSLTVIIERFRAISLRNILGEELPEELSRETPDLRNLHKLKEHEKSSLSRLVDVALSQNWMDREEAAEALRTAARRETTLMERGLVVLEIVAGLAPLLGLLGTVSGLMRIFGNIGPEGLGEKGIEVARGISEALSTTVVGLVIAIPSIICWNLLSRRVDVFVAELDHYMQIVLRMMSRMNIGGPGQ